MFNRFDENYGSITKSAENLRGDMEEEVEVLRTFELFEGDGGFYVRDAGAHGLSAWGETVGEAIKEFSCMYSTFLKSVAKGIVTNYYASRENSRSVVVDKEI